MTTPPKGYLKAMIPSPPHIPYNQLNTSSCAISTNSTGVSNVAVGNSVFTATKSNTMTKARTDLLCKDCVHSYIPFKDWVTAVFSKNKSHYFRCKNSIDDDSSYTDCVTGESKIVHDTCRLERSRYSASACGPEGTHWKPKNKKDLFKVLTK